jgi:predicted DNA-binding protein (UPF0251 family)
MPRPVKCRRVGFIPDVLCFKPAGIPARDLDEVELTIDELESIRLADLEGLYQEDAACRMCVSRQTFANILTSARNKIAECLIQGKALRIEGGKVETEEREFVCRDCSHTWSLSFGSRCPSFCPQCQCPDINRILSNQGIASDLETGCRKRKRCCRKTNQEETA